MEFLAFHNTAGGWEHFFAQDVKRVSQIEYQIPDTGERRWVTQISFGPNEKLTLRESIEEVMTKLMEAWGGKQT